MKDQIEEIIRQYEVDGDFTGCVNRIDLLVKSKPKKKKNPYFVKCMELWFEFFVQEEKGMKPKITPAHGKAINDMIKYFIEYSPAYAPDICFDAIFKCWSRVQKPYSQMHDIVMINKHFNTIIPQIKNGAKSDDIPAHWK